MTHLRCVFRSPVRQRLPSNGLQAGVLDGPNTRMQVLWTMLLTVAILLVIAVGEASSQAEGRARLNTGRRTRSNSIAKWAE